ncbi:MAG: hypothetical protein ACE5JP_03160 [Candidatus Bipolaricaulia bacterium]
MGNIKQLFLVGTLGLLVLGLLYGCAAPRRGVEIQPRPPTPQPQPTPQAEEETRTVTVTGVGVDQDSALENAYETAIEEAVGFFISARTQIQNYKLIDKSIYKNLSGMIRRREILEEGFTQDGVYEVRARITVAVSVDVIQQELAALELLQERIDRPRIMVVIPETHIGQRVPDPAGETEVIRKLIEKRFNVVDQAQVRRIRETEAAQLALMGDTQAAQRLAAEFDAEVLIIGEAFSESAGQTLGLESARARVEARAIKVDTGEILVTNGFFASAADISPNIAGKQALQKAGSEMADYLVEQLILKFTEFANNGNNFQLLVTPVSVALLPALRAGLFDIDEMRDVNLRSFQADGLIRLDVLYNGDVDDLAAAILDYPFSGFALEIEFLSANRLNLALKPS